MSSPEQYTVGWICALQTEYVAARAFLDNSHSRPERLSPNDNNHYTLGEIGGHQVVIAVLPDGEYGTSSAAGVARDMLHSFPNIRFGLMVGIGGGVPTKRDIRLGDVVVSSARNGCGGLLQYDFGKELQGQEFYQTGFLNQPPPILRAAVSGLQAQYEEKGHQLKGSIQTVLESNSRLKRKYTQPPPETDRLYESQFIHVPVSETSCAGLCDNSKLILRPERTEDEDDPAIHYGLIASGNRLIRDAIFRDKMAAERDVLCFEMEAAGLMNHFPCLVIRGVCDYADSHKSKEWQGYAAMVAAAYAKDLLCQIIPQRVTAERKACEVLDGIQNELRNVSKNVDNIHLITSGSAREINAMVQSINLKELPVANGAEFGTYMDQHEEECLPGTRKELLLNIEEWAVSPEGKCIFWLNGLAGTGKSTISRTVAKSFRERGLLAASFFFKRGEGDRGNAARFFPTITKQLFTTIPEVRIAILEAMRDNPGISAQPLKEQFNELIYRPLHSLTQPENQSPPLVIVIDALDECEDDNDIRAIIQLLPRVQDLNYGHLRCFVTSRPELPIRTAFQMVNDTHQDLVLHEIPHPIVEHDISLFLEYKLANIRKERALPLGWPGNSDIQALLTMSVPLFIFAATICRLLEDHNLDPVQCLTEILKYQSEESKLAGTYLPVLDRLASKYNGTRQKLVVQEVRKVIGTIILLESPLSVASLSKFIGLSPRLINASLSSLHSVLNVPNNESLPLRLFHLSFRDFLLDFTTCGRTMFWVDEKEMHQQLTDYCLSVMRDQLKENVCEFESYGTERRNIDLQSISYFLPPELQYSCRYWIHHLARSKHPMAQIDNTFAFLEEHFLHWMEVMSILGVVSDILGCIGTLQSAIQTHNDSVLSEFLHDITRFILKNRQMADIAPLQLYTSALIFAPQMAMTRKKFERKLPNQIHKYPDVEQSWSPELQTLEGHSDTVWSVAFSPDGSLLASASDDSLVNLWNPATGILKRSLEGHLDSVWSVAFSADSSLLASGSSDKTVKLWDTFTGVQKRELHGHSNSVWTVAFSANSELLASGSGDNIIKLWDPATGTLKRDLTGAPLLASGSEDGTVNLWDPITGILKKSLGNRSNEVWSVALLPDATILALGSDHCAVQLWHVDAGTKQQILEGHSSWVQRFHGDDFGRDQGLTGTLFKGFRGSVQSVAFSCNGQLLASASNDTTIKLWDLTTNPLPQIAEQPMPVITLMKFSPDGLLLMSESFGQSIKLWDSLTGDLLRSLDCGIQDTIFSTEFSPDSQLLLLQIQDLSDETTFLILELASVKLGHIHLQHVLEDTSNLVQSAKFSPDSQLLALCCRDNTVKLWNVNTKSVQHTLEGHLNSIHSVEFSPDSQLLASASYDGLVNLWENATGCLKKQILDIGNVTPFKISEDLYLYATMESLHFQARQDNYSSGSSDVGVDILVEKEWVVMKGRKVLWLPPEYRPVCSAVKNHTLALANGSGRVYFLTFSA
ncbi:wd40 protein, putative [Aspergillus lentulus]|uniref:Wd40 protein, putative n=1 Tax=Aspergillus lentulus TaxID=293939 RepID=A0ABQ0ZU16_ASPLE|nr:wd40 protein, putative [Aspergillus lentulus]GFF33840.1 wd40 protein, putative [Aspergillus lentulus]GFF64594.1 wd40 protein, putative [Aspergillus lentulus]